MKRLLLAMNWEDLLREVERKLSQSFEIATCQDGYEALELMQTFAPEIAVIDLMLPGMDGMSVMQAAGNLGVRCSMVALTNCYSDYIGSELERLQVQYLVRRSIHMCTDLVSRVLDLADWGEPTLELDRSIRNTLAVLGINMADSGYRFLEMAVKLYIKNPRQPMVSRLYPEVAARCNGTATQAEKAIRNCITAAWERRESRIWRWYFPGERSSGPRNGEFIARIAQCVSNQGLPAASTACLCGNE